MNYYYKITTLQRELWFIMESHTTDHVPAETRAIDRACDCPPGMKNYGVDEITQVDFETYQAFGIEEIEVL